MANHRHPCVDRQYGKYDEFSRARSLIRLGGPGALSFARACSRARVFHFSPLGSICSARHPTPTLSRFRSLSLSASRTQPSILRIDRSLLVAQSKRSTLAGSCRTNLPRLSPAARTRRPYAALCFRQRRLLFICIWPIVHRCYVYIACTYCT